MALVAGSVVIDPKLGTITSSTGLAGAMFATNPVSQPTYRPPYPSTAATLVAVRTWWADLYTGIAQGVVAHLQANAVARVSTQQVGRVPSGGTGTAIDPPASPVDVPIV